VIATARSCGLNTITWDVSGDDWKQPADAIAEGILSAVTDRSIILLHDGGGDRRQTVAALPRIIRGLRANELTFVNLSQQRW
jgi:peptidoglycan/xylan/chitin deacetylase (PgdA/CDA1 family)